MQLVAVVGIVVDVASMNDEGAGKAHVSGSIIEPFPLISRRTVLVGAVLGLTLATAAITVILCGPFAR